MSRQRESRDRWPRLGLGLPAVALLAAGVAACGGSSGADSGTGGTINGSGATFPAPVYQQWGADLKSKQGLTVNYQAVGSGQGVADFTAGTVDFGASDAALKDEELKAAQAKGTPLDIPTVFGAVTVSYNAKGVPKGLKLDGATVASIYLGKVTSWNDPAIARQNPGVKLPASRITVVHRSDESGTTKLFTSFLEDHSPQWASQVGSDKSVKWPTGTGAKGNDGVAAAVKQTDGSIGYVEQAYALANGFTFAAVKNKAGNYVVPSLQSTSAAGDGLSVPADLRFSAINAPGAQAYPIASATFVLVYRDMCKAGVAEGQAKGVKQFLDYGLGAGQAQAQKLGYAPLPPVILSKAKAKVAGLQCNGKALG